MERGVTVAPDTIKACIHVDLVRQNALARGSKKQRYVATRTQSRVMHIDRRCIRGEIGSLLSSVPDQARAYAVRVGRIQTVLEVRGVGHEAATQNASVGEIVAYADEDEASALGVEGALLGDGASIQTVDEESDACESGAWDDPAARENPMRPAEELRSAGPLEL
jgi:hypothetical protein